MKKYNPTGRQLRNYVERLMFSEEYFLVWFPHDDEITALKVAVGLGLRYNLYA